MEPREDSKQLSGQQVDCDLGTMSVKGCEETRSTECVGGHRGLILDFYTVDDQAIASA